MEVVRGKGVLGFSVCLVALSRSQDKANKVGFGTAEISWLFTTLAKIPQYDPSEQARLRELCFTDTHLLRTALFHFTR